MRVKNSDFIEINPHNASISVYEPDESEYSDLQRCGHESMNKISSKKFYLRAIYVPNKHTISKTFTTPGRHKITVTTANNLISDFEYINIKASK
jgi:hypothetical protein